MKIGIFLSYIGLGSNLLHLTYCHEIAKKYGPVSVVTICKNLEQALEDDPLIKEVIYIEKYYKKLSDILKLSKSFKAHNFDYFYIFYPSIRFFLASKFAGIKNVYTYQLFKKKDLHLVKTAKKFVEEKLNINSCPTETKLFISKRKKEIAKKNIKTNKKNIIIGAGSSGHSTRWGELNFINLIKKLNKEQDYFFHILCGPNQSEIAEKIIKTKDMFLKSKENGAKIIICGNGGSAAIASHVSVDLTKNAKIRSVNFNESDLITCFANDYGYEKWVEKAVDFYADSKDVLVLISSSGKSLNMVNAAKAARNKKISKIITFSGHDNNNPLSKLGDINFWINSKAYNFVENLHQIWLLTIVDLIIGKREHLPN